MLGKENPRQTILKVSVHGLDFRCCLLLVARTFQEMSQWRQKCQSVGNESTRRWIGLSWIESSVRITSPAGQCSARFFFAIYYNLCLFKVFVRVCQSLYMYLVKPFSMFLFARI